MYSPNNIRFRIVSSSAIAQFRQDQAFDFNELINNTEYSFSSEARETLLLNYDLWFRFILRLEKVLIRHHTGEQLGRLVEHIEMFAREIVTDIHEVMKTNPEIFDTNSVRWNIVDKAITSFYDHVLRQIHKCTEDTMYTAFPKIVIAISNALNNLLFILHETENLKNGHYFLSYTDEAVEIYVDGFPCPLIQRAKLYQDAYGESTFVLKNYTKKPVVDKCIDNLAEAGAIVTSIDTASL
jgi:hypothetical protein